MCAQLCSLGHSNQQHSFCGCPLAAVVRALKELSATDFAHVAERFGFVGFHRGLDLILSPECLFDYIKDADKAMKLFW